MLMVAASPDVHVVEKDGRRIVLVGTAHVSRASADLVREVIRAEEPDRVCVELDEKRYQSLIQRQRWESLNLREVIRDRQLSTLLANLVLASYQKKLGDQLGVVPGAELLEAVTVANESQIPVSLCDRDIRVTMRRAWHSTSWWKKSYLLSTLLVSLFDRTTVISEEKLAELRDTDTLTELLNELGQAMPELKTVLIDERDTWLAEKIKAAPGQRIVAVVGAGHVRGILAALDVDGRGRLAGMEVIPPASPLWKVAGWSIPLMIVASLGWIALEQGLAVARDNLVAWIFATGVPSSIGALLALAHPFTVLSAFAAAPITTLSPVIGAGYVTAFVQVMMQPPMVREFDTVLEDMAGISGWWRNRLLKVFLAFLLPSLGAMVGTWIGGYEILKNAF